MSIKYRSCPGVSESLAMGVSRGSQLLLSRSQVLLGDVNQLVLRGLDSDERNLAHKQESGARD
jgi:hypothetical protein